MENINNDLLGGKETLQTWRAFTLDKQIEIVENWQANNSGAIGANWSFDMVTTSTITLRRILTDLNSQLQAQARVEGYPFKGVKNA